jgi:hypothetical protein
MMDDVDFVIRPPDLPKAVAHVGFHPLRRMVKWVATDPELAYKYEFGSASSAECDNRLFGVIEGFEPHRPRRERADSQLTVGDGDRA